MIELKLSQGAKPGYGRVLPAVKKSIEISPIRNVSVRTTIIFPSGHTAFRSKEDWCFFRRIAKAIRWQTCRI